MNLTLSGNCVGNALRGSTYRELADLNPQVVGQLATTVRASNLNPAETSQLVEIVFNSPRGRVAVDFLSGGSELGIGLGRQVDFVNGYARAARGQAGDVVDGVPTAAAVRELEAWYLGSVQFQSRAWDFAERAANNQQ